LGDEPTKPVVITPGEVYSDKVGVAKIDDPVKRQSILDDYKKRFAVASERGIPLYIMNAAREVYEYVGLNPDGTVEIGKQLTPEEVARGRAGLSVEKRRGIGEKLLTRQIFRGKSQAEAEEIIKSLDNEIPEGERRAA
jgi:hypothetical protein